MQWKYLPELGWRKRHPIQTLEMAILPFVVPECKVYLYADIYNYSFPTKTQQGPYLLSCDMPCQNQEKASCTDVSSRNNGVDVGSRPGERRWKASERMFQSHRRSPLYWPPSQCFCSPDLWAALQMCPEVLLAQSLSFLENLHACPRTYPISEQLHPQEQLKAGRGRNDEDTIIYQRQLCL